MSKADDQSEVASQCVQHWIDHNSFGMGHHDLNVLRIILATLDARDKTIAELRDCLLDAKALLREYTPGRWTSLHERIDAALATGQENG